MRARIFLLTLVLIFPWSVRRAIYRRVFGYRIADDAIVGRSLIDARRVSLGPGSRIGSLSIIRNLDELILGEESRLGSFNWVAGFPDPSRRYFVQSPNRRSVLSIGDHSAVTARHVIDCTDSITMASFSTLAGHRSQLLTHAIDLNNNMQACAPIVIGHYCFIGTGAILLKGARVPDYSVIAAGSVVSRSLEEEGHIYGGNPATKVKPVDRNRGYFARTRGAVG
ncbi:MAG: acyltransferase [Mesorhizobium sp.]|uniref:acyltransferase n=1 Tax=Mesorhizobium sp. TaxID=1871066 RepID=UPI000FE6E605|nr:hypothetical protein [Mesorhizobium sp.]RWN60796.1 MAG: acyltransferase [Mesorhizobium sp.]RWO31125.1 MAG: acyltransferase [Mesorhizobium sp.]TIM40997.1 MAG: acyltransferase [Mesorhizobium sp.]